MLRGLSRPPTSKGRLGSLEAKIGVAAAAPHGTVVLRYLESAPMFAQGAETGRQYRFSARERVLSVDARDAAVLLRTGFFRETR